MLDLELEPRLEECDVFQIGPGLDGLQDGVGGIKGLWEAVRKSYIKLN